MKPDQSRRRPIVRQFAVRIYDSSLWSNRRLLLFCFSFWIMFLIDTYFTLRTENIFWQYDYLPWHYKTQIYLYAMLHWLLILAPLFGFGLLISVPEKKIRNVKLACIYAITKRVILVPVISTLIFVYLASWALFKSSKTFIGYEAISFIYHNGILIMGHVREVEEKNLWLNAVKSLLLACFLVVGLPVLSGRIEKLPAKLTTLITAGLIAFGIIAALGFLSPGFHIRGDKYMYISEQKFKKRHVYSLRRRENTTPLVKLASDLAAVGAGSGRLDLLKPDELTPRINLDEYTGSVDESQAEKYNVILILIESLRADRLEIVGNRSVMPFIDKLAKRSLVFPNCYAQATHSDYADLCPLSSLYPLRSNFHHSYAANSKYPKVLIYDILRKIGYKTAIISSQDETWGTMDKFLDTGNLDFFFHAPEFKGDLYTAEADFAFTAYAKCKRTKSGKIPDEYTLDIAAKWIKENRKKPFFIYMNLQRSHFPYVIPEQAPRPFKPHEIDFDVRFGQYPKDKKHILLNAYDNSLHYIDLLLEKFYGRLCKLGLAGRTIIIISGDTGQAFYEHDQACHSGKLYEEVLRVPLVFHVPGIEPAIDDRFIQHVDVPPTLMRFINLPQHPIFQGVDLAEKPDLRSRSIFVVSQSGLNNQVGIVRDKMKLVIDLTSGLEFLFDIGKDPRESNNLLHARPETAFDLKRRLMEFRHKQIQYYTDPKLHEHYFPPRH